MVYSYETKVKAVTAYKNGIYIDNPGNCKDNSWKGIVREWANIFEISGFEGLKHKTRKITLDDKESLVIEIQSGHSIKEIAHKYNISSSALNRWYNSYLQNGIDGLKSKWTRRQSMPRETDKITEKVQNGDSKEFTKEEIQYILAENEYLKKVKALIQKKNQIKKK